MNKNYKKRGKVKAKIQKCEGWERGKWKREAKRAKKLAGKCVWATLPVQIQSINGWNHRICIADSSNTFRFHHQLNIDACVRERERVWKSGTRIKSQHWMRPTTQCPSNSIPISAVSHFLRSSQSFGNYYCYLFHFTFSFAQKTVSLFRIFVLFFILFSIWFFFYVKHPRLSYAQLIIGGPHSPLHLKHGPWCSVV